VLMTAHRIDPERINVLDLTTFALNKPLTPQAIAEKVAELLEQKVGVDT